VQRPTALAAADHTVLTERHLLVIALGVLDDRHEVTLGVLVDRT
jgi:hypothetical protein